MGELLDNYENVRDAIKLLSNPKLFGLARSRITVSTVGLHKKFDSLAQDLPGVSLAFSLHAPTQETRESIVPSARAHKLPLLIDSLKRYCSLTTLKVFIEYVMLKDINDSLISAKQLAMLLQDMNVTVNLIPYNPVIGGDGGFSTPSPKSVSSFRNELLNQGIRCTTRQEKGRDISGACGQLVVSAESCNRDIEDLC